MKTYHFCYSVSFGRGDGSDPLDFEYEVTDEQYELLRKHDVAGDDFSECQDLQELYDQVAAEAEEEAREELLEYGTEYEEENLDNFSYYVDFWGPDSEYFDDDDEYWDEEDY